MKTIKTLAVAVGIIGATSIASQAGSWGFAINTGAVAVAVNSFGGGYQHQHCTPRQQYVSYSRREHVNPYMPTVYGPREYYVNGRPYMVYPQVQYIPR
jgi:hypothetical protein